MLEHVSLNDFRTALAHIHRMLRPGRCFRLVVPDLVYEIERYVESTAPDRGHAFIKATGMGVQQSATSLFQRLVRAFGLSRNAWLFDESSMSHELEAAGFSRVRRCQFGASSISEFAEVEELERFQNCLSIECTKADSEHTG